MLGSTNSTKSRTQGSEALESCSRSLAKRSCHLSSHHAGFWRRVLSMQRVKRGCSTKRASPGRDKMLWKS